MSPSYFPVVHNHPNKKAGSTYLQFENGQVKQFTLAENWKARNGAMLLAGTVVEIYKNGKEKAFTLAEDWTHPSGAVLQSNTQLCFDNESNTLVGILAQDFHNEDETLNSGIKVAITDEKGKYTIISADAFARKTEIRRQKGIHVIISDDENLLKSIKNDNVMLWSYRDKKFYRHYNDVKELYEVHIPAYSAP